jgi:hypothetical protein
VIAVDELVRDALVIRLAEESMFLTRRPSPATIDVFPSLESQDLPLSAARQAVTATTAG